MTNAVGRPIEPLVLSSDERAYLERQVRRRRVARSLSERCRVILRCADGVPSKSVASELGVHEHTVGKWRRRFLKDRIGAWMKPVPADLERSKTTRLPPLSNVHSALRQMTPRTGRSVRWRRRRAFRTRPSAESGQLSVCSPIVHRHSSFPATRCSSTRSVTLSVFIYRRPIARWCLVSTRRARYKLSIANSRSCR